jgi:transposase
MTKSRALRRSFDPEFKREAVRMFDERRAAGVPIGRVAKELGVRPNQLREWARQLAAEITAPSRSGETAEQELRRLRREVVRLRQEAEFAKKAAAFFARESR